MYAYTRSVSHANDVNYLSFSSCLSSLSACTYRYLSKKVPLPEGSFEQIRALDPGEALVYSARPCIATTTGDDDNVSAAATSSSEVFHVQIRKRLTADRGKSRRNQGLQKPI